MTSDVRQHLGAQPFIPFTVHVADGREYRVPTPEHAHVHPGDKAVSLYTGDDREFVVPARLLSGVALDSE